MQSVPPPLRPRTRLLLTALFFRELLRAAMAVLRLLGTLPFAERARRHFRTVVGRTGVTEAQKSTQHAREYFRARRDARPVQKLLLSCGESSSERHAIALIEVLRREQPGLEVHAFGGARLAELPGVTVHVNLVDRAVIGIPAALAGLPFFMRAVGIWIELLERERPDAVVLVDNPGLHMVLAERARPRDVPVLYYICPQYWAWASWRMKRFGRCVDAALAILPFEPPLFTAAGVPCGFAGHPMLAADAPPPPSEREHLLVLLPGSRRKELERHFAGMLRVARALRTRDPALRVVVPQANPGHAEWLRAHCADDFAEIVEAEPRDWLPRAELALVKSGTSTMETAISGTPMVVCYRLTGRFESLLVRWMVHSPWFGAPNLVLGEEVVPEHVFRGDAGWDDVERSLAHLLEDEAARAAQLRALARVRERLAGPGAPHELRRWLLD